MHMFAFTKTCAEMKITRKEKKQLKSIVSALTVQMWTRKELVEVDFSFILKQRPSSLTKLHCLYHMAEYEKVRETLKWRYEVVHN
jgi:hypothetical protein